MLHQTRGGFVFCFDNKKEPSPEMINNDMSQTFNNDETVELPDMQSIIDTEFTVEKDITYIHTNERI